jgi:hypothetical protein
MNRLRVLVVVLGVMMIGLLVLLAGLLVARGQGMLPIQDTSPAAPGGELPQRTLLGLLGILSSCGCLLLIGAALGWFLVWNRRTAAARQAAPGAITTGPSPGTPAATLALMQGSANTSRLVLAGSTVLIGSERECTLVLEDPRVAPVHARLDPIEGG